LAADLTEKIELIKTWAERFYEPEGTRIFT